MPNERMNETTRREWRELGFFYDCDSVQRRWLLVGDRGGLRRFAALLREYAADPTNAEPSEHGHYGPYKYLEVQTALAPGVDGHSIHGTLANLRRLADIVEGSVARLVPTSEVRIDQQYSAACEYSLVLRLKPEGFDPARADPMLSDTSG